MLLAFTKQHNFVMMISKLKQECFCSHKYKQIIGPSFDFRLFMPSLSKAVSWNTLERLLKVDKEFTLIF